MGSGSRRCLRGLWLQPSAGRARALRDELAALYDAFETPRQVRGDLEFLRDEELHEYMAAVRERALGAPITDGVLHELVIRHELQHTETMLQAMTLAGITPPSFTGPSPVSGTGLEMIEVPEGPFEQGAGPEGFAYDNERPRHTASTARFTIGRTPVTNAAWAAFIEDGGYTRRELWSDAGWAWRERGGHHRPRDGGPPTRRSCTSRSSRPKPSRAPMTRGCRPRSSGRRRPGWSEGVGEVWEWTASHFTGYPGFVAHPYREYSEVFFGDRYRVLRGGSCATHPRVASKQFRNWDLPERRQLFAGVRIAR